MSAFEEGQIAQTMQNPERIDWEKEIGKDASPAHDKDNESRDLNPSENPKWGDSFLGNILRQVDTGPDAESTRNESPDETRKRALGPLTLTPEEPEDVNPFPERIEHETSKDLVKHLAGIVEHLNKISKDDPKWQECNSKLQEGLKQLPPRVRANFERDHKIEPIIKSEKKQASNNKGGGKKHRQEKAGRSSDSFTPSAKEVPPDSFRGLYRREKNKASPTVESTTETNDRAPSEPPPSAEDFERFQNRQASKQEDKYEYIRRLQAMSKGSQQKGSNSEVGSGSEDNNEGDQGTPPGGGGSGGGQGGSGTDGSGGDGGGEKPHKGNPSERWKTHHAEVNKDRKTPSNPWGKDSPGRRGDRYNAIEEELPSGDIDSGLSDYEQRRYQDRQAKVERAPYNEAYELWKKRQQESGSGSGQKDKQYNEAYELWNKSQRPSSQYHEAYELWKDRNTSTEEGEIGTAANQDETLSPEGIRQKNTERIEEQRRARRERMGAGAADLENHVRMRREQVYKDKGANQQRREQADKVWEAVRGVARFESLSDGLKQAAVEYAQERHEAAGRVAKNKGWGSRVAHAFGVRQVSEDELAELSSIDKNDPFAQKEQALMNERDKVERELDENLKQRIAQRTSELTEEVIREKIAISRLRGQRSRADATWAERGEKGRMTELSPDEARAQLKAEDLAAISREDIAAYRDDYKEKMVSRVENLKHTLRYAHINAPLRQAHLQVESAQREAESGGVWKKFQAGFAKYWVGDRSTPLKRARMMARNAVITTSAFGLMGGFAAMPTAWKFGGRVGTVVASGLIGYFFGKGVADRVGKVLESRNQATRGRIQEEGLAEARLLGKTGEGKLSDEAKHAARKRALTGVFRAEESYTVGQKKKEYAQAVAATATGVATGTVVTGGVSMGEQLAQGKSFDDVMQGFFAKLSGSEGATPSSQGRAEGLDEGVQLQDFNNHQLDQRLVEGVHPMQPGFGETMNLHGSGPAAPVEGVPSAVETPSGTPAGQEGNVQSGQDGIARVESSAAHEASSVESPLELKGTYDANESVERVMIDRLKEMHHLDSDTAGKVAHRIWLDIKGDPEMAKGFNIKGDNWDLVHQGDTYEATIPPELVEKHIARFADSPSGGGATAEATAATGGPTVEQPSVAKGVGAEVARTGIDVRKADFTFTDIQRELAEQGAKASDYSGANTRPSLEAVLKSDLLDERWRNANQHLVRSHWGVISNAPYDLLQDKSPGMSYLLDKGRVTFSPETEGYLHGLIDRLEKIPGGHDIIEQAVKNHPGCTIGNILEELARAKGLSVDELHAGPESAADPVASADSVPREITLASETAGTQSTDIPPPPPGSPPPPPPEGSEAQQAATGSSQGLPKNFHGVEGKPWNTEPIQPTVVAPSWAAAGQSIPTNIYPRYAEIMGGGGTIENDFVVGGFSFGTIVRTGPDTIIPPQPVAGFVDQKLQFMFGTDVREIQNVLSQHGNWQGKTVGEVMQSDPQGWADVWGDLKKELNQEMLLRLPGIQSNNFQFGDPPFDTPVDQALLNAKYLESQLERTRPYR